MRIGEADRLAATKQQGNETRQHKTQPDYKGSIAFLLAIAQNGDAGDSEEILHTDTATRRRDADASN